MNDQPTGTALAVMKPQGVAGARPMAIVATTMDEAWRMSEAIARSGLAPNDLNSPEKVMVAVMYGAELGLPPMAAVQSIAVMNGRPVIWGDAALGIVQASGLSHYVKEWTEGEGEDKTWFCETHRKGDPEPKRASFSIAQAKQARLWDTRETISGRNGTMPNPSPWYRFRERMMQMRARGFNLRDTYADLFKGMRLKEEVDDGAVVEAVAQTQTHAPAARRIAPPPPPPPPNSVAPSAPQPATGAKEETKTDDGPKIQTYAENPGAWFLRFDERAKAAKDIDELAEVWDTVEALGEEMSPADYEDCAGIYRREEQRLAP